MEALHAPYRTRHTPGWPAEGIRWEPAIAVLAITIVSLVEGSGKCGVGLDPGIHFVDSTGRLQTGHSSDRQGTSEPVSRREWSAIIEQRWNRHNHRKTQRAPNRYIGESPQRASDLGGDDFGVNRQRDQRR